MKRSNLFFGFDVEMDKSSKAKPTYYKPFSPEKQSVRLSPSEPLPYMSDVLADLSFHSVLYFFDKNPAYAEKAALWKELDPHPSLFEASRKRVESLQKHIPLVAAEKMRRFEDLFKNSIKEAFTPEGVDFAVLTDFLNSVQYFEEEIQTPLVYNYRINFSAETRYLLHCVESFLFNMRSVIAVDFNAQVRDTAHECFKVDSIQDYLPKPEYVVSDALLYYQFKKMSVPFTQGPKADVKIDKLFIEPMAKAFMQYTQNACYLVNGLPQEFLADFHYNELEEVFYLAQMDWLLGTDSGILFKIREELFGIENGYEKIFWPDLKDKSYLKPARLRVCVELDKSFLAKKTA